MTPSADCGSASRCHALRAFAASAMPGLLYGISSMDAVTLVLASLILLRPCAANPCPHCGTIECIEGTSRM